MTGLHSIPEELRKLKSVVVARFDLGGGLLDANAGFLRLLPREPEKDAVVNALEIFISPHFGDLLSGAPVGDGLLAEGLFTLGSKTGPIWTLTGRLQRVGEAVHFFAEHDIEAAESLQEKVLGLNQDLTEARRQVARMNRNLEALVTRRTAELAASEARFRNLVEQSLVGICILQDGLFRYANPALLALTASPGTQSLVTGPGFLDLVVPTDRERIAGELARIGRGEVADMRSSFACRRSNGSEIQIEWLGKPCEFTGEAAVIAILLDVSERHRAEAAQARALAEAERLSRLKTEFMNNMSHELLTPLNGVIGMAGSVMRAVHLEKARAAGARILESGKALQGIVASVLDFSAIESEQFEVRDLPYDLSDTLDRAARRARAQAQARQLDFRETRGDGLPPYCRGDAVRIGEILDILLGNAVKFTPRGEVAFSVAREGTTLLFRVEDSGIGMSPEQVERLFHPFEQADGSATRRFGGTGLGLALAQHLARLLGGGITVASEFGKGSRFELHLPLRETGAAELPTAPTHDQARGTTLLVLEDNTLAGMILGEYLNACDMPCEMLEADPALLERLQARDAGDFAAVLIPCDLRGDDELELLRGIHQRHPQLPIVGTFYDSDPDTLARCRLAGMTRRMMMPYTLDRVRELLAELAEGGDQEKGVGKLGS